MMGDHDLPAQACLWQTGFATRAGSVVCRIDVTIRYRIHLKVRDSPTRSQAIYRRSLPNVGSHPYLTDFTRNLNMQFFA
jgi:hypothetical protein